MKNRDTEVRVCLFSFFHENTLSFAFLFFTVLLVMKQLTQSSFVLINNGRKAEIERTNVFHLSVDGSDYECQLKLRFYLLPFTTNIENKVRTLRV